MTVAFLKFSGTDKLIAKREPEAAGNALHELVTGVQEAVDEQGVCFLASDVDADGGKLILTAGAPINTGSDEERMLFALRRIADADHPIPIQIGVNRGGVFAGDIGPWYRQTYTVMGDAVNLAARLMAKAGPAKDLRDGGRPRPLGHAVRRSRARTVLGQGQDPARAGVVRRGGDRLALA